MKTKELIMTLFILLSASAFLYGCYYVAKTVSYNVFYEDMVEDTVKELVKKSCLEI
jgi:hypothetical protein